MKRWFTRLAGLLLLSAALPLAAQNPQKASPSAAQSQTGSLDVSSYEKRVSVKTLPNGLTVILWRRPEAPVFSFFTMVDAGSAQDPLNETGLAHMMEHMAFKGTPDIGTTDYAKEKPALEKVEQTYAAYDAERIKRVGQDPQKLAQLKQAWQDAIKEADQYVIKNQFGQVHRGARRSRRQRVHQLRRDGLHVLAALEPDRAVGGAGIRSHEASRLPRVLQGAQRGDGRAPHADRQPAHRPAGRAVPGHRLHGKSRIIGRRSATPPIWRASPRPTPRTSSSTTTCPATW